MTERLMVKPTFKVDPDKDNDKKEDGEAKKDKLCPENEGLSQK